MFQAENAEMTFEQMLDIRNKIGTKEFDSLTKTNVGEAQAVKVTKPARKSVQKRSDKNMPQEVSSKRPATRKRNIVEIPKSKFRDPRFEPLSGKLNNELFERSYGFIQEYEAQEVIELKDSIKKEKDADVKGGLQAELNKITSKLNARKAAEKIVAKKQEWRKQEAELVKNGKTPYFMKNSEFKRQRLVEQYNNIGKDGMNKFLEKKRKKNAMQEHRKIPMSRRSA